MNVGKAVRLLRTMRELKQKELALRVGASPNYISLIERGEKQPSIEFVERISAALDVPVEEIFALSVEEDRLDDPRKRELLLKLKELMLLLNQAVSSG